MTPALTLRAGRRLLAPLWLVVVVAAAVSGCGPAGGSTPAPQSAVTRSVEAARATPDARLLAVGDVGTGDGQEQATAKAAVARGAGRWDALLLLGDNIYENGDPAKAKQAVLAPFADVLATGTPLLAALGNHDVRQGHGPAQLSALGQPGRWFSRAVGPLTVIVLDSNDPTNPVQLSWLDAALASASTPWTVVAMHHPMYSAGYHGSDLAVRAAFGPLIAKYHVPLVLAGHDHDYQRSRMIDGTTYLVSGAGAKLRDTGSDENTAVSLSTRHFLDLSAYSDHLVVQAVDQGGEVIDGVVLRR